ncbi:MAG TPA: hypothetical protein VK179_19485 [Bacteroidales bacterium]|nr:hypothetical protein [Bacteroidales bacterium]
MLDDSGKLALFDLLFDVYGDTYIDSGETVNTKGVTKKVKIEYHLFNQFRDHCLNSRVDIIEMLETIITYYLSLHYLNEAKNEAGR